MMYMCVYYTLDMMYMCVYYTLYMQLHQTLQGGTMSIATITFVSSSPTMSCACYVTDNGIMVCIIPLLTAQLAESEKMRKEDDMRFQKSYEVCTCVAWATFVACTVYIASCSSQISCFH